jgi:nicotinamidase/pyrazinamidase
MRGLRCRIRREHEIAVPAGRGAMKRTGRKSALVVTDVQNDFCPGGNLPVPGGDQVIPVINRLMSRFEFVVASQDWHPLGHASFASTHPGKQPFDAMELRSGKQTLWPDHCVPGTSGAEFHPDLDLRSIVLVVRKGWRLDMDSYSTFFENDRLTPTGLEYYLKGMGIGTIYLTGLAQDFCVYYSARDALRLGFETFIVDDATRGLDQPPGSLVKKMKDLEQSGVGLIDSGSLLR